MLTPQILFKFGLTAVLVLFGAFAWMAMAPDAVATECTEDDDCSSGEECDRDIGECVVPPVNNPGSGGDSDRATECRLCMAGCGFISNPILKAGCFAFCAIWVC